MSNPRKVLVVIDEQDEIIEQIPCDGTNFSQQRELEKETRKRYGNRKVKLRVGYVGVSKELFDRTKKLLDETFEKYPEIGEAFVKERPEFIHLGYNINKKYKK
jgi:hypothetical protein